MDILTPLHKSDIKSEPNNFRGIAVSSCFGKLFNKILQKRLKKFCTAKQLISPLQGSGKQGSRTSDHLLIVRCLIDKYVKKGKKHLFTCFVDLKKAFDTVPRIKLFYTLLKEYSIGGNFLNIIQQMYSKNQIFVKLSNGLLKPFITTIGLKQGCVFSPILFNLYIDRICSIFDESCAPVKLQNMDLNCLLWADDLMIVSRSSTGLQHAINKMSQFYQSIGLEINIKKTKIMIMNKRGLKLDQLYSFHLNGNSLEIVDQYQYLGVKFKPSGSFGLAVQELNDKASRAWFGISKIIFQNKRMEIDKIFGIFNSLVTPVASYGCPVWLPNIIPKKYFEKCDILEYFGKLQCEALQQKCARITLSVHNKTPRLAVLGELGIYPLLLHFLSLCFNYKLSLLSRRSSNVLIGHALSDFEELTNQGQDCWLSRINKMEANLKIPSNIFFNKISGKKILLCLRGKFDRYYLHKIKEIKMGEDMINHNKLRTYQSFKSSFTQEPYLTLVRNRNQRCHLTRLRVSSHFLGIETGRFKTPVTPIHKRTCQYCKIGSPSLSPQLPSPIDDEFHFLVQCPLFSNERSILFEKLGSLIPSFSQLSLENKFKTILCPTSAKATKLANRFIGLMFKTRMKIDQGE